jgi:hypothetical protein
MSTDKKEDAGDRLRMAADLRRIGVQPGSINEDFDVNSLMKPPRKWLLSIIDNNRGTTDMGGIMYELPINPTMKVVRDIEVFFGSTSDKATEFFKN